MAYEKKDGDISVFRNETKTGRQPDFRGELLLNGVNYEVALWERRDGDILSGTVKVNEKVQRDKETHNLIAGAAYLAARQAEREPLYETAQKMNQQPTPEPAPEPAPEPTLGFDNDEDDLPF